MFMSTVRWLCLIAFTVCASACTDVWYLTIERISANEPEFCFSREPNCRGSSVQFSSIDVYEVGEDGGRKEVVWSIQGTSTRSEDYAIKRLKYGQLPTGWTETVSARPLRVNLVYSVRGMYYFWFDNNSQTRVLTREEFFHKK